MLTRRFALASAAAISASALASSWAFGQSAAGPGRPPGSAGADDDPALLAAIESPLRSEANRARDRWRHPLQTLAFWGVAPGLTVIDIAPGGGYWTEILAPYLAQGGGRYLAGLPAASTPDLSDEAKRQRAAFEARFSDAARYGSIAYTDFTPRGGLVASPGSADFVLLSRGFHDLMWTPGAVETALASFYVALAPGGLFGVEQHRADPRAMVADARDGYVAEGVVIAAAEKAGFKLQDRSEINANPKDSKDHPFGVWTLPPTRRSAPPGQPPNPGFDHTRYDTIGESDRMTLRFAKPA
jgi:predicted methyltransferase